MNVRFTGRHVELEEGDREYAEAKATALGRFHKNLHEIEIRVDMDGARLERVEMEAGIGHHHRVVGIAEATEFRTAIDAAADHIKRQLLKDKEKDLDRKRRAPSPKMAPDLGRTAIDETGDES
ncbi:MAG: ribosome hibernation-promoting factor, HPF/YfiA family [Planctomycetota bacterium]|jgi:ribosomal subunit interface protein